jgi:peptidoglycan hydrolase-like protein with peptidoglycan-binding domain
VSQVAGLQVALRAWGLYAGPIDAVPGPATRAAVRAFQQQEGLRVDGIAGPQTRGALGPLGRPLLGRRALRLGVFGWDVSVLQFELTRVGLYPWPIDGYFGPETARALRQFQRRHGLVADGVAGPRTLARIRRGVAPMRAAVPPQTLVVRPGDTLTAIARRLGTTPGVLARENGMVLRDVLLVGTRSRRYGVDSSLARALAWMESGYQPNVVSHAGAWGVMQIIPTSWEYVEGVLLGEEVPRTVEGNVRVGVALLHRLLQEFGGDERLALGAWYQGARAVRDHGLFPETRAFVADVLALRSRV